MALMHNHMRAARP